MQATAARLPDIEGHTPTASLLERFGEQHRIRPWLPVTGAAVGAIAGFMLSRGRGSRLLTISSVLAGSATFGSTAAYAGSRFLPSDTGPALDAALERAPDAFLDVVRDDHDGTRVMTFNIRGGLTPSGFNASRDQLEAIADRIAAESPDVVVLQEVDRATPRSGRLNEPEILTELLGPDSVAWAPARGTVTGREQGLMVMTFNGHTISDARNILLPDFHGDDSVRRGLGVVGIALEAVGLTKHGKFSGYKPRNVIDSMISTPEGETIRVLGTHITRPNDDQWKHQVDPIARLADAWDGPQLLVGDMNISTPMDGGAELLQRLRAVGLTDALTEAGLAADSPDRISTVGHGHDLDVGDQRIDHVYASDHFTVDDAFVDDDGTPVSDHNPVVADVRLDE